MARASRLAWRKCLATLKSAGRVEALGQGREATALRLEGVDGWIFSSSFFSLTFFRMEGGEPKETGDLGPTPKKAQIGFPETSRATLHILPEAGPLSCQHYSDASYFT